MDKFIEICFKLGEELLNKEKLTVIEQKFLNELDAITDIMNNNFEDELKRYNKQEFIKQLEQYKAEYDNVCNENLGTQVSANTYTSYAEYFIRWIKGDFVLG